MPVSLKHTFQSTKTDSADTTIVQPSNWNEEHQLTLATNKVLGRATAGTGAAEELSVGTALSVSGGTLAVTNVPVANGGTGASTLTGVVKGNGTSAMTAGPVALTSEVSGTLPVANGGTGAATLTANSVLIGNGTSAVTAVAPGTAGNLLTSNGTAWVSLTPAGSQILQVNRTSNTQLVSSNISNLINITSGTFSQTFAAAATLGNGWFCYIRNAGTGEITLDPNASETIDGLTSYIMYPSEVRLVQCNGTSFTTVVLQSFYTVFTGSGTFTKPPGYSTLNGILWGGGGSGASGGFSSGSGGGGGGCGHSFSIISSFFSNSCNVTIGAGGAGVNGPGNAGGDSSFDGKIFATGGGGGFSVGATALGGSGGGIFTGGGPSTGLNNSGFGGPQQQSNQPGGVGYVGGGGGGSASSGGNSFYGGAGGGGHSGSTNHPGGTSTFGGAGGAAPSGAGSVPGGGGGGRYNNVSGSGARGELRIWGGI